MQRISVENFQIISYSDRVEAVPGGYILTGSSASLEFGSLPQGYYRHGWQSWSLATWLDPKFRFPDPKPAILQPLQTDPLYVAHPAPNGSWLGAVAFEDGNILLLGALGLEAHVALHGHQLHGWYEAGRGDWFAGYGEESAVFARYAELLGERLGRAPGKPAPRVWCSWYSLYSAIDETLLGLIFEGLRELPFDVLQVDDGWQVSVGDWSPNQKFPSGMQALAANIRATGRTPGLWLAPLAAVQTSSLARQHPDWLLRSSEGRPVSAGFNWGEPLYALDTTNPAVMDWVRALMEQVRAWGFDYVKLDFLYAGALSGVRHAGMPREAAYRQALQAMRAALGADAYLLACGAPILPSLGLCDALRAGPDVAGEWENRRDAVLLYNPATPGTRNAIRTTLNRLWLQPLAAIDPDVAYFSALNNTMTGEQKQRLKDLALICGYKATSDLPQWLSVEERQELRAFLESGPTVERTGRYTFTLDGREVDFGEAMQLPAPPSGLDVLRRAALGWLGNQGWALKAFDRQGKKALQKRLKKLSQSKQ